MVECTNFKKFEETEAADNLNASDDIRAPMPGMIIKLEVAKGDEVIARSNCGGIGSHEDGAQSARAEIRKSFRSKRRRRANGVG